MWVQPWPSNHTEYLLNDKEKYICFGKYHILPLFDLSKNKVKMGFLFFFFYTIKINITKMTQLIHSTLSVSL